MKIFTQIHDFCVRVTSSKIFKNTIVLIILINSIVLGLITSEAIYAKFGELLEFILSACVVIFTVEITLRIIAKGWRFFLNGWNIFDFLLITMALMPETGAAITFRVFRVLRALRMVSSMKKLRHIVSAILVSAPHVFWAAVLEMIIFYIFGIMGQNLFHEAFPQWFGTLGETVYTLFQVTTLESWSMGIARPVMKVYPWAWMYFVPFVMISSYIVLNVVVGVVVNATSDISEDDNISMKDKIKAKKVTNTELSEQINELKEHILRLEAKLEENKKDESKIQN
ncbi:MAG: ion transporter [Bacteroidales bacterium]|nr:ion transporter [Paludibacteraceae bacterium]MDD5995443.1 ion transporter [Bacteroidales bacterium]